MQYKTRKIVRSSISLGTEALARFDKVDSLRVVMYSGANGSLTTVQTRKSDGIYDARGGRLISIISMYEHTAPVQAIMDIATIMLIEATLHGMGETTGRFFDRVRGKDHKDLCVMLMEAAKIAPATSVWAGQARSSSPNEDYELGWADITAAVSMAREDGVHMNKPYADGGPCEVLVIVPADATDAGISESEGFN